MATQHAQHSQSGVKQALLNADKTRGRGGGGEKCQQCDGSWEAATAAAAAGESRKSLTKVIRCTENVLADCWKTWISFFYIFLFWELSQVKPRNLSLPLRPRGRWGRPRSSSRWGSHCRCHFRRPKKKTTHRHLIGKMQPCSVRQAEHSSALQRNQMGIS